MKSTPCECETQCESKCDQHEINSEQEYVETLERLDLLYDESYEIDNVIIYLSEGVERYENEHYPLETHSWPLRVWNRLIGKC